MDAMLQNKAALQDKDPLLAAAVELGKLLDEHRGGKVVVMDMRSLNFWTDFFIIATVTSTTHLAGLERHIKEFARERGLEILHSSRKSERAAEQTFTGQFSLEPGSTELGSGEWHLLDMGGIVIHLMTAGIRSFYELERLWNTAPVVFPEIP